MTLRERLARWWRRRRYIRINEVGKVSIDVRYYLESPKVQAQIATIRALRDGIA